MKNPKIDWTLLSSLLQFDESLRSGRLADTQLVTSDAELLENLELGQAALQELEAAIPRRVSVMPSWAPQKIGRFEIRSVLGAGGFAVVYLAFDPTLNRQVALKIPRPHALVRPELRRRFVTEAQAAGKLDHPHIVPVYEAGEDGDLPYIACALCEGPTLASWFSSRTSPLKPKLAAMIVRQLASAVQYSHERGILHRDIKPGNVLLFPLASSDDEQFPFVARLGDFGLAKLLESGDLDTVTSQLIGTPQYMSPELIKGTGQVGDVTPDVYALGAILYCLVLGQPPFGAATAAETFRQIVDSDAIAPDAVNPAVGRDLSLVCMKCLRKTPHLRYASAAEFGEDLDRFLAGRPVRARRISVALRIQKWCLRRPMVATLLAVSCSLAAVLLILAIQYTTSLETLQGHLEVSNDQLKRRVGDLDSAIISANKNKVEAEENRTVAAEQVFAADLQLADSLRLAGDIGGANRILEKYDLPGLRTGIMNGPQSFAWRYLKSRTSMVGLALPDAGQSVWSMRLSRDGSRVAMCGDKGIIRIVDVLDSCRTLVEHQVAETELNGVAWSDTESLLAASGDDGVIRICNASTLQVLRELDAIPGKHVYEIAFLPGTTQLLVSGRSSDLQLWDGATGQLLQTVATPHARIIESLAVSGDGKQFVTGGDEGIVCVWRADDLSVLWQDRVVRGVDIGPASIVRFSPNGKFVAVCAVKNCINLYDSATGRKIREWDGLDRIQALAVGNNRILCGNSMGLLSEFSLEQVNEEWKPERQWMGHDTKVSSLSLLAVETDGVAHGGIEGFVSADRSGKLWLWPEAFRATAPEFLCSQPDVFYTPYLLCWQDNTTLLRCGTMEVDRLSTASRQSGSFFVSTEPVVCCGYAAAAGSLVIANNRGQVTVVPNDEQPLPAMAVFSDQLIIELSVDVAATRAVVRGQTNEVAVINLQDRQILARLFDREASVVSPNGRWVVSGNRMTDAFDVFEAGTMQLLQSLPDFDPTSAMVTFAADSGLFIAAGGNRTISIWDTATWRLLHQISSRSRGFSSITMHPDGRTLATSDGESRVKLWDVRSGRELMDLGTFPGQLHSLSFSPNGETLGVCHGHLSVSLIRGEK